MLMPLLRLRSWRSWRWRSAGTGARRTSGGAGGPGGAIKFGLVTDVGGFNDRSFNQSAIEGLKEAKRSSAFRAASSSRSASDYVPNLARLARQGYIAIGVGFLLADGSTRRAAVPEHEVRDHRLLGAAPSELEGHAEERAWPDVQGEREQLHDRLPRRAMAKNRPMSAGRSAPSAA